MFIFMEQSQWPEVEAARRNAFAVKQQREGWMQWLPFSTYTAQEPTWGGTITVGRFPTSTSRNPIQAHTEA